MSPTTTLSIPITPVAPGRWTCLAGPEWSNPGGGLWGGFAIGLCIRVLEAEPEAVGEALSLTLTFARRAGLGRPRYPHAASASGRLGGGGVGGGFAKGILGSDEVGVHAIVTMARRPKTPDFAFAKMPEAPAPESLPSPDMPGAIQHYGASAFERRTLEGFPPTLSGDSRSLAWVRSRRGPLDKALLGMITDHSAPRAMYALGPTIMTTTLSLTAYLHARTLEEIAEVGDDFILVECEGRVGGGGASDERSSYWRRDGKLLATSEQLAWYRELRRSLPE